MCVLQAIITGEWDDDIATSYVRTRLSLPFPMVDFGTTILCLDVHISHPCFALRRLTTAVIKFYGSKLIKSQMSAIMHRWASWCSILKDFNVTEKRTAKTAIQRNAFHTHLENPLVAMLADPDILQDVSKALQTRQTSGQSRSSTEHKVRKTLKMWGLKGTVMMEQAVTRRRMKNIPMINEFGPSNWHDWLEKEHITTPALISNKTDQ